MPCLADTCELFFDDCQLPGSALLGPQPGRGFAQLMSQLPQERVLIAAMAQAAAEAMFEWTRSHVKDRQAFGRPLLANQVVAHQLAALKAELAAGRSLVDRCLSLLLQRRLSTSLASQAKLWTTEMQGRVADACVQLHGGAGYMRDYDIGQAFVDARVTRIYGGSNAIMQEIIARDL